MEDRFRLRVWDKKKNKYNHSFLSEAIISEDVCFLCAKGEKCSIMGCECKIEQCTGCKDKNKILIYENDIVKLIGIKNAPLGVVKWAGLLWNIEFSWGDIAVCALDDFELELKGNVNQNSEFLEKNEK